MEHSTLETLPSCPLCNSPQQVAGRTVQDHSISGEAFSLAVCSSCGFCFTNPRPGAAAIGRYYQGDNYISHNTTSATFRDKLYRLARSWALGRKHATIHALQPNGRVLDVGCGTGDFLAHLMSRGYMVEGVEPSLLAREQAIANHSLRVVPALEQLEKHERYQVVTMWHVLEHVPDLRATFKKLFALLADRGLLLIAVPDRQSWDAAHYGSTWAAWDVPRHLSHFRRPDVHRLLREHGFELVATRKMWLDALYIAMLSEQYKGRSKATALILGTLVGTWSNVLALFGGRPTSSSLFIARKIGF